MSRNLDNLRDITTFLMMHGTSPTKGFTAREIADAVPTLKERSVYRILETMPQFVQTKNSIHPKRYYFDPLKVVVERQKSKYEIRPEFKPEDVSVLEWLQKLIKATRPVGETSPVYSEVKTIGAAGNNALQFQRNETALQPALWESAKYSVDVLEKFAAQLYLRMQEFKSDPRYSTNEWWAMFSQETK